MDPGFQLCNWGFLHEGSGSNFTAAVFKYLQNGLTREDSSMMQEVEEMVEEADVNNDGQVNYAAL
jgi:hypothetical protein